MNSIVALVVCLHTVSVGAPTHNHGGIAVIGKATVVRKPDAAYVTVFVRGTGALMSDALRKAEEQAKGLRAAVTKDVKEAQDIVVFPVSLGQKSERVWRSDAPEEARPEAVLRLRVRLPANATLVASVIDIAIRNGAALEGPQGRIISSRPSSAVAYVLTKYEEAEVEALRTAYADALAQAEKIKGVAKLADFAPAGLDAQCTSGNYISDDDVMDDLPSPYTSQSPDRVLVKKTIQLWLAKAGT